MQKSLLRCPWCPPDDPLYIAYHDKEWGVPERNGRKLFTMLNLEGAQAGLSWRTVLHRRAGYQRVFEGWSPSKLAQWTARDIERALSDPGIIRNRLKVKGVVRNARAFLTHFRTAPRFSEFLWSFVDHHPIQNCFKSMSEVPTRTLTSDAMSKALKQYDFTFVGSTICYAFMQATGMVNDHLTHCPRHLACQKLGLRKQ